ncbi:MAG: hypothetical protein R3D69_01075 [Xanthobacteraceae bacterium]
MGRYGVRRGAVRRAAAQPQAAEPGAEAARPLAEEEEAARPWSAAAQVAAVAGRPVAAVALPREAAAEPSSRGRWGGGPLRLRGWRRSALAFGRRARFGRRLGHQHRRRTGQLGTRKSGARRKRRKRGGGQQKQS